MKRTGRSPFELRLVSLSRGLLEGLPSDNDGVGETGTARARASELQHADVCMLPWFRDERPLQGLLGLVDWRCNGSISCMVRRGVVRGARAETLLVPGREGLPFRRVVLLGCGLRAEFDCEAARDVGERTVAVASNMRPSSVAVAMPCVDDDRELVESVFGGVLAGLGSSARRTTFSGPNAPNICAPTRWWVVVAATHVSRLRRVFDGPLRAASEGT